MTGSVAGRRPMRGIVEKRVGGPVIALGPAWCRIPLRDGAEVGVVLEPEGPQRADLAADIAAALDAAPDRLNEAPTGSAPDPDRRDGPPAAART